MEKLTQQQFNLAKDFIRARGRRLETALLAYYFENGSRDAVLAELEAYQNPDGGFGHAIEPDFTLDLSSPMATTVGFQTLRELGIGSDHPMVQRGIDYFLSTWKPEYQTWQMVPEEVNSFPHAPWWSYSGESTEFCVNPCAEIAGYLIEHAALCPSEMVRSVKDLVLSHLESEQKTLDMYSMFSYLRFAESLSGEEQRAVLRKLRSLTPWENRPGFDVSESVLYVTSPQSPSYGVMRELVDRFLEIDPDTQQTDGSWLPNWEWGMYPEDWQIAKVQWQGILTLQRLIQFRNFGRIGGLSQSVLPPHEG